MTGLQSGQRMRRPGRGDSAALLPILILAGSLCAGGCGRKDARAQGRRSEAPVPVLAARADVEDVPVTLRTIGTAEAFRTVSVTARVGGTLTKVHFREGQDVGRGDRLFSIDPGPYEVACKGAEAELARERARYAAAKVEAARSARLLEQNLVSPQDHDRVAAAAAAESAAVLAQEATLEGARLNLAYCSIESPISGRTSNVLLHEGNLVKANDDKPLVIVNQLSPIFVSFSVPQKALPEIMQRSAEADGGLAVAAGPPGEEDPRGPAIGKLTFINNAVDASTGTVLLKAEFENADRRLWPGQFVEVTLTLSTRKGALVVPAGAVQSGQKGDYVLVVKADDTTEMRPVTTGFRTDGKAVIERGLEPGETVITDGHLRVIPGGKVAIQSGLEPEAAGRSRTDASPGAPGASGK